MRKNLNRFSASEFHLLDVMSQNEPLSQKEKIPVFKKCFDLQAKLVDASLRDKDFDPYFALSLAVQKAWLSLLSEVVKAVELLS